MRDFVKLVTSNSLALLRLCALAVLLTAAGCGGGGSNDRAGDPPTSGGDQPPQQPPPPPPPTDDDPPPPPDDDEPPPPQPSVALPNPAVNLVYVARQDDPLHGELYQLVTSHPGEAIKLSGPQPANVQEGVTKHLIGFGGIVVYIADHNNGGRMDLFAVDLVNAGNPTQLNRPLNANGDVIDFTLSPDRSQVIYAADDLLDGNVQLFRVDLADIDFPTQLGEAGSVRTGFTFSPDGKKFLYRAIVAATDTIDAFLVDLESPGPHVAVNPPLPANRILIRAQFTPDSQTIVYAAEPAADDRFEVFAVPVAFPGAAARLNGPLIATGSISTFQIGPDSQTVLYNADQDTDGLLELYSVTLATPGISKKINRPLLSVAFGVSGDFRFSPDGRSVIYRASEELATRRDLYLFDLAGNGPTVRVNPAPNATFLADTGFRFSADGSSVLYSASEVDPPILHLYETSVAAPGTATKLTPAMNGVGVGSFEFFSVDTHLFYRAKQNGTATELFSLSRAHPGISEQLSPAGTANVASVFEITPAVP
jgi:Tol biopolymer transport system component